MNETKTELASADIVAECPSCHKLHQVVVKLPLRKCEYEDEARELLEELGATMGIKLDYGDTVRQVAIWLSGFSETEVDRANEGRSEMRNEGRD